MSNRRQLPSSSREHCDIASSDECNKLSFCQLATHRQRSAPTSLLPVDPTTGEITPSPTWVDGTLSKLLNMLRNKEGLARETIEILGLLLNTDESVNLANKIVDQQDAENLIEKLLCVFDKNLMDKISVTAAKSRARRLVTKLAAGLSAAPRFLLLNPDEIITHGLLPIDDGGLAVVYKSSYRGVPVALKRVRSGKIDKKFLQEALTWRTLSHKYILPFIGIFVDHSGSFVSLIAPFMENGTLRDWRQNMAPAISEIKKRIREVAEGLLYLHSEGIVHGDLKGSNVLLDDEYHVKIADFGSTMHVDSTASETWTTSFRFAAPEIFFDDEEDEERAPLKGTKATDIYAFGCLYYEIHFGVLPFGDMSVCSIIGRVKKGLRPKLRSTPRLDEHAANLINQCWDQDPVKRPRIAEVLDLIA